MHTSLHPLSRRRLVTRAVVRIVVKTVLLVALYALAPVSVAGVGTSLRLLAVVLIVAVMIVLQVRMIAAATYPELRAVEALVTAILVFIVLFALLYLGLAAADPASFTRPLTRVSALYFTVTILATVGFGDITAQSDVAQVLVTSQMLLDLGLIALTVRVFSGVARAAAARRAADQATGRR